MNNNLEFENEDPSPNDFENNHPRTNYGEGFTKQERMYSEDDMRKAYDQGIDDSFDMGFSSKDDTNFNVFIKQFKKK
jgi:hypothetical protein